MSGGTLALIAAGLSFGAAIGILLLVRAWLEQNRLAAALAALILVAASAGGLIVLSWQSRQPHPGTVDLAGLAELALTLAVGPLILIVLAALLRASLRLWLAAAPAAAAFIALVLVERRYGGDPIVHAVPIVTGYALVGWFLFVRSGRERRVGRRRRRHRRLALALLVAAALANLASLARLFFPGVEALRPIVPWTISALFAALLVAIVWGFLQRSAEILVEPSPGGSDEARLASRAAALIATEQLFRDPKLKPATIASRLGIPPSSLAAALAAGDDGGFADFVQAIRLDQARTMLSDPAERATSIEAVGLLCGFRSRSAFYDAFRRRFGTSPGAFRSTFLSGR